jgi:hypothetical protein
LLLEPAEERLEDEMQHGGVIQRVLVPVGSEARLGPDERRDIPAALEKSHQFGQGREVVSVEMWEDEPGELERIDEGMSRVEAPFAEEGELELAGVVSN